MSGLAKVLAELGFNVSGSDIHSSFATKRLKSLGARIFKGHRASHLGLSGNGDRRPDAVVVSSAVSSGNPEVVAAKRAGIPVLSRAEMLAMLMKGSRAVAVAGTHGKTTTTSMIALVFEKAKLDPTVVVGGEWSHIGGNAKVGLSNTMVVEADESDGSFLKFYPSIAIVTNIEDDHMDYYKTVSNMKDTYLKFIHRLPKDGVAVLCGDHPNVFSLLPKIKRRFVTYGFLKSFDVRAESILLGRMGSEFQVYFKKRPLGKMKLGVPGLHNVYNALAAVCAGIEMGLHFKTMSSALSQFRGVQRRFERKGKVAGVLVVDDYAHHPTEIKATLAAAKGLMAKRVVAVFQPHRYSRTFYLANSFRNAFDFADVVLLLDIYPAQESPIPGVSAVNIFHSVREADPEKEVIYVPKISDAVKYLQEKVRKDDLVLTLGAGDVYKTGEELLKRLRQRQD